MKTLPIDRDTCLLWGVLILAFLLRIGGIQFGLPSLYHADEPIVVNHALAYGVGDFNPHFFKIPPLISYLLFVCYGIYYIFGLGVGWFHSLQDFENLFYTDPTSFYIIARFVFGVFLGTLSIYLLYRMVQRFWEPRTALWAALFLAVNFLHARDCHYIYVDIPLLFVMLLALDLIFASGEINPTATKAVPSNYISWEHLWVGSIIGLAVSTKYNGIFLAIPYFWICVRRLPKEKLLSCWSSAGLAAVATVIVLNPYAVLDVKFFVKELTQQSGANVGGYGWGHHLSYSLLGAFEVPFFAFAVAGWLAGLFSKKIQAQALAIFVFGYYLVLLKWGQPYDRYVLPLVPPLCILTAVFLSNLQTKFPKGKFLFAGLMILFLVPSLIKIIRWDHLMLAKDTRTLAQQWIENNIPSGSRVALDGTFFMPRLAFSPRQLDEKKQFAGEGAHAKARIRRLETLRSATHRPFYELYFLSKNFDREGFLFAKPIIPYDIRVLAEKKIEYVVMTHGMQSGGDSVFQRKLLQWGKIAADFSPFCDVSSNHDRDALSLTGGPFLWNDIAARERNGYPIQIYRSLRDSS